MDKIKDIDEIDIDKSNFVFNEAKDKLRATVDSFKSLQFKCFLLLSYCILFLLFISIDMSLDKITTKMEYFIFIVHIIVTLLLCIKIVPSKIHDIGYGPEKLFKKDILNQDLENIIYVCTVRYKERIDGNHKINQGISNVFLICFILELIILMIYL